MAQRAGHEPSGETLAHDRFVSLTAALMATDISTSTTELPESRVRVEAEVGPAELERRMAQAARLLARNIRVPGFRAGKAPPPVVIKRVGREAVLDEAVRESLGNWYRQAIDDKGTTMRAALESEEPQTRETREHLLVARAPLPHAFERPMAHRQDL